MSAASSSPNSQTRYNCKGFFDSEARNDEAPARFQLHRPTPREAAACERTSPQESGGICMGFFAERPAAPQQKTFESPVRLKLSAPPKDFPQACNHVEEDMKELHEVRSPFPFLRFVCASI